ncbi:MAG: chromate efflux transporter [Geobacteraceae bacterium]|nr:chromate efflux transporter [Geobacteraceae bacterium]
MPENTPNSQTQPTPPREPHGRLFLRFLRFGALAWGGPVAQIAMIRQELVEEERWVSRERFNRVLAVYQALPGPEAHELCVYFGMVAGGRIGGLLAGLGFMLPGFVLMLALSWFYVTYGIASPLFAAVFYGCKPAVAAVIVRAVQRIGGHALVDPWLWGIAVGAGIAGMAGVHFLVTLPLAGAAYVLVRRGSAAPLRTFLVLPLALAAQSAYYLHPSLPALFGYGLRSGLLTFGGAYTVIPFLQHDAVVTGGWMTNAQFLDGLALSGIIPAPLIIFSTFVGFLGGGLPGGAAITAGIFLPSFAFTLIGQGYIERLVENRGVHAFLDGIAAGVVGLIAFTALGLFREAVTDLPGAVIFALALAASYLWKAKGAVAAVMLGAGVLGWLIS